MNEHTLLSRRNFLKLGAAAVVLAGGGWALGGTSWGRQASHTARALVKGGDLPAEYLRQIIAADNSHCRTIMWQSAAPLDDPQVEFRPAGQTGASAIPAQHDTFTDDGVTCTIYTAQITGLTPGTAYEYRIASGQLAGDWQPLRPDDGGSFQALLFPDSQSNDYSGWRELAQAAARRHPDAAFFVNMGDLVDNGEDHTQWNAWFDAVDGINSRIPLVPLMGNHETYNQQWKVRLPEAYLHEFAVPENGSAQFARYYYSFDYGPVHFIVLNTQWDETEEFKPGLLDEQLAWFPHDMQKNRKKWNIVLLHKDVLQYRIHNRPERTEGISEEGRAFMPLFDALGIDVVFSAHLHTYRNRGRLYNFQPADHGPLYILTGVAGNVRYPGLWVDHAFDKKVAPQPETDNYLTLDASADALEIRCFLPDGTEIDHTALQK